MKDPFDDISSSDFSEFRKTFRDFLIGKTSGALTTKSGETEQVKVRLLDLLLNPDAGIKDTGFRGELEKVIERISEINTMQISGSFAKTSDILNITFDYKSQILKHLENYNIEETKRSLWRQHLEQFFDTFIMEIIRRWEDIESDHHLRELDKIRAGKTKLQEENERLRGIYSLSLEISQISNPIDIYKYLADKLPSILPLTALIILDGSQMQFTEYIFPVKEISSTEIDTARSKLEDVYELFQREVINRNHVKTIIYDRDRIKIASEDIDTPESVFVPMIDKETTWGIAGALRYAGAAFTPQEVQALSIVTSLVDQVVRNINALKREKSLTKSLDRQIKFARTVQQNVLPQELTADNLIIKTRFKPSETLSGDFYQFFKTDMGDRGVVIGDVTGHGVPAGMMMMTVMGILSEVFASEGMSVTEMLKHANHNISRIVDEEFFVTSLTFWLSSDNQLNYFNAGHPPGLLRIKETGKIIELKPEGFPLGIFQDLEIIEKKMPMAEGDEILLYTDGIIEARNRDRKPFGISRLKEVFAASNQVNCSKILDDVMKSVYNYTQTDQLQDDVALVLIKYEK